MERKSRQRYKIVSQGGTRGNPRERPARRPGGFPSRRTRSQNRPLDRLSSAVRVLSL